MGNYDQYEGFDKLYTKLPHFSAYQCEVSNLRKVHRWNLNAMNSMEKIFYCGISKFFVLILLDNNILFILFNSKFHFYQKAAEFMTEHINT